MVKKYSVIPRVEVRGQSFKGVKRSVVPNQSMSLREIVTRFIKKESLPISKEGIYSEVHGDLEKIQHEDFTEKMDRINDLKSKVKKGQSAEKERLKKEGEDKEKARLEDLRKIAGEELEKRSAKKPEGPANSGAPPS